MFKLENLIGLGFENITELKNFIAKNFDNVKFISDINKPTKENQDEFVYIYFDTGKIVDLFIARGESKKFYIIALKKRDNLKLFKLLNQNHKHLGCFSNYEDALNAAKILSPENEKIYLETWGYRENPFLYNGVFYSIEILK